MHKKSLKILMIGTDRNLLKQGSAVAERAKDYGQLVKELHIVLLSDSGHKLKETKISENVWVYPTNSFLKYMRPIDAARMGKRLVFEKKFTRGESVITAQDPFECGWAGMKIKKKWRLPLELQLHTDPFSQNFGGFQNFVRKFFLKKIIRSADSIRVVTEDLKGKMLQFTRAEINVLPIFSVDRQGIENSPISFDLHARYPWHFILLSVARLSPEKNLPFTLQVLALVREKFPSTGLVIVGTGPEEGKLKQLVKNLGLTGAVEFAGWQDDLSSFYKTANAFIQTSFYEGYGLALIEAGLSGLPVITTPVGIAKELEPDKDALVYPFGNVRMFADGVIDLIENLQKRESMKMNIKHALESKLLPKEEYLNKLISNWKKIALKV